jgi:catechol 2,3-dioxygenase-like lactoylglutathione lyase family enzyme
MINAITHSAIYVLDQDEAVEFYVGKLGLELHTDADLGFMRWLTVNVPGQPEREILLEKPGPPAHDEATAEQIRELVTKGAMGLAAIFTTDDIHNTYETLVARGVEFNEEPTERFYGTDCGFRDPFGNQLRLGQPKPGPIEVPDPSTLAEGLTPRQS